MKPKHSPDTSETGSEKWADNCTCGAEIVFYEAPLRDSDDHEWRSGYGCSALGRVTQAFWRVRRDQEVGL